MTCARSATFVVLAMISAPGCRGEAVAPSAPSAPGAPSATSASTNGPTAPSTPHAEPASSGLPPFENELKMKNAVASLRGCKVDTDCVLVRVSCGAEAAVASASKADAERAMLAACPQGGVGGWSTTVPKVMCVAAKCELRY